MTTDYKVTELFCIIDEFCKHFDAENVLIAGRVAVFTDSSIEAMQIYKEILRAMNKCFTKKNNIFVSQEVLSLLEDGWRLTCNYNAPCENDFK